MARHEAKCLLLAALVAAGSSAMPAAAQAPRPGPAPITEVKSGSSKHYRASYLLLRGQWLRIGPRRELLYPYRSGRDFRFKVERERVFLSKDGGPLRLVGIRACEPGGMDALRETVAAGTSRLAIWCHSDQIDELPALPERGEFALVVTQGRMDSLAPLTRFRNVEFLCLHDCRGLADLGPLRKLARLVSLHLNRCADLTDLSSLPRLPCLAGLHLGGAENLADLGPLARLPSLNWLMAHGSDRAVSLSPWSSCQR